MIASLPMYARPELDYAISLLWDLIRKNLTKKGIPAPITLSQDAQDIISWLDPGLVLSQTCGMPYRNILHGKVQLVGTPNYDLPNCLPGHYFSVIVVQKNDPRLLLKDYDQAVLAYNMEASQSGYAAPLNHAAAQGIHFPNRIESHGHLKSAEMVVSGKADIAAIEASDIDDKIKATENNYSEEIRMTTFHDVKGETLDAVLIISSKDKKSKGGHYEHWISESNDEKEYVRFAYVASSRPKHLLIWAIPKKENNPFINKIKDLGFE